VFSALNPLFLIGTMLAVFVVYLVTAGVIWLRQIQVLEQEMSQAESEARSSVVHAGNQAMEQVQARVQEYRSEFDHLSGMI
jgi:hypothetical protein